MSALEDQVNGAVGRDTKAPPQILTRARGAAAVPVGDDARGELAALRRTLTTSGREVHRATWRRAVQARTTTIARVLRVADRALRVPGGRVRSGQGWLLFAATGRRETTPVLQVITRTATRSLTDLAAPLPVVVDRRDLVDVAVLDAIGECIRVTFTEVG